MNSYNILRDVHKMGSMMRCTVLDRGKPEQFYDGPVAGNIKVETSSEFPAIIPYNLIIDSKENFSIDLLPLVGTEISATVYNFVDGTLYLNALQETLTNESLQEWDRYYEYLETVKEGQMLRGTVTSIHPFGFFVDFGTPYHGLLDIGHLALNSDFKIDSNRESWPAVGSEIECVISSFDYYNKGLRVICDKSVFKFGQ